MSVHVRLAGGWPIVLFSVVSFASPDRSAIAQAGADPSDAPTTPMEAVSRNIQVFKGVSSAELLPIMNYTRASLGVRCDYCHIAELDKFQLDDKPAKQRARDMIRLTRAIKRVPRT